MNDSTVGCQNAERPSPQARPNPLRRAKEAEALCAFASLIEKDRQ